MGRMDGEMQRITVMQEFGWTFQEYMDTPKHVIDLIVEKMKRDQKRQELQANRAKRGN